MVVLLASSQWIYTLVLGNSGSASKWHGGDASHYHDDDVDNPRVDMTRIRQSSIPHRGGIILAMGLLALILFPYTTIICGPMAWMMGNTDLAEIRAGRMDPSGEG